MHNGLHKRYMIILSLFIRIYMKYPLFIKCVTMAKKNFMKGMKIPTFQSLEQSIEVVTR